MRARMISQVRLDGLHRIVPAAGMGWAITEPAGETVSLVDHDLGILGRIPIALASTRRTVSATKRFIAVADDQEIAVLDRNGGNRWRSPWARFTGDAGDGDIAFHVDRDGILWARLPTGGQLMALDAASGSEIDRISLTGPAATSR
jgi:hypothetical protein